MRFTVKAVRPDLFVIWDLMTGMAAPYGLYSEYWLAEAVAFLRNRQEA